LLDSCIRNGAARRHVVVRDSPFGLRGRADGAVSRGIQKNREILLELVKGAKAIQIRWWGGNGSVVLRRETGRWWFGRAETGPVVVGRKGSVVVAAERVGGGGRGNVVGGVGR